MPWQHGPASGVTHYVYISGDLKSVEVVGSVESIAALMNLSNVAATRRLTDLQVIDLRRAFGVDDVWTSADKICVPWERRLGTSLLLAAFL